MRAISPGGRLGFLLLVLGSLGLSDIAMPGSPRLAAVEPPSQTLPGTQRLTMEGDIASAMIDGIDRFLLKKIAEEQAKSLRELSDIEHFFMPEGLGEPFHRDLLGLHDPLIQDKRFLNREVFGPIAIQQPLGGVKELGMATSWQAAWANWPVYEGVEASGLVLTPKEIRFVVYLIPDAGQSPFDLCGITPDSQSSAIQLVEQGGLVVIPTVIQRQSEKRMGRADLTDQEYLYRSAFELGRHIVGYQVQEGISAFQALRKSYPDLPCFVAGWGEGGWIALHLAVEAKPTGTLISGHFGPRDEIWKEPLHRNIHGLLVHGRDAYLATSIVARGHPLVIDAVPGPEVRIMGGGAGPGVLQGPTRDAARREFDDSAKLTKVYPRATELLHFVEPSPQATAGIQPAAMERLLVASGLSWKSGLAPEPVVWQHERFQIQEAREETLKKWDRFQQRILASVHLERERYWRPLDTRSVADYERSIADYREAFRNDVIGDWKEPLLPFQARSRLAYDRPKWVGYEVMLDVFDDVFAYGVLLIPKGLDPNRKHPCVVFQHGLEGRPQDTIEGNHEAYHDVAAQLAERGYIVFAPQNPYLFEDRFRSLQRKSNALGRTLFSTIVPQHQQIVDWLQTQSQIDPQKIGFYGLSYGGKSAMRIPALVTDYCLSICSADFNDWVWKNASTESPYSYVWTPEYEIFEFGLGPRFNYLEMASLICPRPFMVERGHFDGVAPDDRVAMEYAKVKHLYAAKLGIGERTEIEWVIGPHTINGKGTLDFLDRYLK